MNVRCPGDAVEKVAARHLTVLQEAPPTLCELSHNYFAPNLRADPFSAAHSDRPAADGTAAFVERDTSPSRKQSQKGAIACLPLLWVFAILGTRYASAAGISRYAEAALGRRAEFCRHGRSLRHLPAYRTGPIDDRCKLCTRCVRARSKCACPSLRHIAHALACPKARYLNHTENGRSSVIVIDETGKIVLENGVGVRMLALASGEPVTSVRHARLPDWLTPLVANFNGIWPGGAAAPPTHERCNAAGRFTFKAYRFDHADAMTDHTLIAIYAEHFAPLALEIETRGFQLGLSERQRQLCTYLLFERPHGDIAQLTGIRKSTVIDHVRKIYEKLDVHGLAQLKAAFRGIDGGTDRWYM